MLQKWAEIFLKSVLLVSMDMGQIKGQPGERKGASTSPKNDLPGTQRSGSEITTRKVMAQSRSLRAKQETVATVSDGC